MAKSSLAQLRAARSGKGSRLASYKINEDVDIYQEVDDDTFREIKRDIILNEDFVVGDNNDGDGDGYIDNGADEWDHRNKRRDLNGDYESDEEDNSNDKKHKKRKVDKKKDQHHDIKKFFKSSAVAGQVIVSNNFIMSGLTRRLSKI